MLTKLDQKNRFILALREYLKSKYKTNYDFTYCKENCEIQGKGGAYSLAHKNLNEPKEIIGFYFRKDLCLLAPQNASDVTRDIYEFSTKQKKLETILQESERLNIKINNKKYMVSPYVGKDYAGEISVNFIKSPDFSQIKNSL